MRIKSIRIRNFRGFADVTIPFDALTTFVGPNGAGKSTVLCALNIFFQDASNTTRVDVLTEEDFHRRNIAERVEVTLTFHELSVAATEALSDYVRHGEIIVSAFATFDPGTQSAKVSQSGIRMAMAEFSAFFKAFNDNEPVAVLNPLFEAIREQFPDLPVARSKDDKAIALRAYEAAHQERRVPLESADTFYGIAGNSKLRAHVQWVYVPAVKDASDEQTESKDSAFGKLLARTVRSQVNFRGELAALEQETRTRYNALLGARQEALDQVSASLTVRMAQWCHPDAAVRLSWTPSPISIKDPSARATGGDGEFLGDLSRFGHGFQRSYLIALLQELSATGAADGPTLLLGCEEPELYQHPPQARHLAQVLRTLSEGSAQVVLTTHSPYFVSGESFESVRMVRKDPQTHAASVRSVSFVDFAARYAEVDGKPPERPLAVASRINETLRPHLNELFFARGVVLLEGSEDIAYLMTWMTLSGRLDRFRSLGLHAVQVEGKSRLARPVVLAEKLGIPFYVVFDADGDCEAKHRQNHQTDNQRLLRLFGQAAAPAFPDAPFWHEKFVQWPHNLSALVDVELTKSLGADRLNKVHEESRTACGHVGGADKQSLFIQSVLMGAHAGGATCATLERLCEATLAII